MIHLAQAHRGLIVAVEHRFVGMLCVEVCTLTPQTPGDSYYGISYPTPDFSTPNLRFLTSRQALADLVAIRADLLQQYGVPASTRTLTFGGSYPVGVVWCKVRLHVSRPLT
jgi:hypothetical protein